MLEVIIQDGVERLLAALVPSLTKIDTTYPLLAQDSASTPQEFIKNYFSLSPSAWTGYLTFQGSGAHKPNWMPTVGAFAFTKPAAASGWLAAFFNPTTDAWTTEDTTRGLNFIQEDNSGVVWAVGTKAGFYGLWKRTGVGAWTQVLTDTTAAGVILCKWTTGALFHKSSTGNWYSITNGAATLSADPSGGDAYWTGMWTGNNDRYMDYQTDVAYANNGTPYNLSDSAAWDNTGTNDYFWIWKYPQKTRVMRKSMLMWTLFQKTSQSINAAPYYIPVANSNYWLCILVKPFTAAAGDNRLHIEASICNFVTGNEQYLGGWDVWAVAANALPVSGSSIVQPSTPQPGFPLPCMAYMSAGVVRLYSLGYMLAGPGAYNHFGVMRQDITAKITV